MKNTLTMKSTLSLDWLAIQYEGPIRDHYPFEFKKLPYGCREFRELFEVYRYGDLWGHVSTQPTLPSLKGDFFILKLENKYLYDTDLSSQILDFEVGTSIRRLGLSRVDICLDFQQFDNGMEPAKLIKDFAAGKIDCLGKMGGSIVRGQSSDEPYSYLSLGARTSDVRVYLYNKTKEMKDVKWKTWIAETWKKAGLDLERPVWRLEVSLKGQAMKWADQETGDLWELNIRDLTNPTYLQMLSSSLFHKYFGFVPHSNAKNRYKNQRLELIKDRWFRCIRVNAREHEDSNRSDRIFIKKALAEAKTSAQLRPEDRWHVVAWLYSWACDRGLEAYVHSLKDRATL